MYVPIAYWILRNNSKSEKMKLDDLTSGVSQSLKADDRVAGGYGFLYLLAIGLFSPKEDKVEVH
jgi:hypothetical protein